MSSYLGCNWGVKVDVSFWSANGDNEAVRRWQVVTLKGLTGTPPAFSRVNCNESSASQFSGGAIPNILMQRTAMALPVAQDPVRIFWINRIAFILALSCCIDAYHEVFSGAVQGALYVKTQAMRRVVKF